MFYFNLATKNSMRDRFTLLMQHRMLLRGVNTRRMDLPDLFTLDFKDEGCSECPSLVLLMKEGKTNQTGKTEYAATIRHKDYKHCAFGGLAFYFFTRWHISNELFPNFERNSCWFDTKVLKSNKGELFAEIDYKTQYNSICKAFDACGINRIKKTHAGRGCGARHAEIADASEDQLRRHGRWNAQSTENNYLTCLPRQSIRIINGLFGAGGQFWLPRSSIIPPESLMKKVFPMIKSGYEDESNINSSSSGYPKTIGGQEFLALLKKMRCILLQDAVFLRVEYPQNPIFCNSIFREPEFLQFESALLDICRNQDFPQEMKLKDVVPELGLVNLVSKLPNFERLDSIGELELITTYVDPILTPLFHEPESHKHFIWSNKQDENTKNLRPDGAVISIPDKSTDVISNLSMKVDAVAALVNTNASGK